MVNKPFVEKYNRESAKGYSGWKVMKITTGFEELVSTIDYIQVQKRETELVYKRVIIPC